MARAYVFGDAAHDAELARLRALERAFDAETQGWLARLGLGAGWHCVEVGAGAGSIARWMCGRVGPEGKVLAIDLDPRFLVGTAGHGLEVFRGDVRDVGTTAPPADLVHARFVLIHQRAPRAVLEAMIRLLKPGGWLVAEEPDFSLATARVGSHAARASFASVNRAIAAMFERRGMDARFGSRLPRLLAELGLEEIVAEVDTPVDHGGGAIAGVMAMSTRALEQRYLESGLATPADIEGYLRFAADPSCSATYHGVVRARGRTPRHSNEESA